MTRLTSLELSFLRSPSPSYQIQRQREDEASQRKEYARAQEIQRQAHATALRVAMDRDGGNMTDGIYVNL